MGHFIQLPASAVYIIGFTMLLMLLAIIGLAVALYLAIKNKKIFGLNLNNKEYIRQESTGVAVLYNSAYDDQDKNNGSTLTMNSGIIEINRVSDPETPSRIEDSRITFTKRPLKPIVPVMHRGQMDAICREVLSKVQKSDSASFRDLNELLNGKSEDKIETKPEAKPEVINEIENETKNEVKIEFKNELQVKTEPKPEIDLKNETQDENKMKVETGTEKETKPEKNNYSDMLSEIRSELKSIVNKDVKIEINHVKDNKNAEDSETETEYDTVPSPVRYRQSGDTDDFDLCNIPVYDVLPRRSYEGTPVYDVLPRKSFDGYTRNVVQMDQDSQYLLPLSTEKTESGYVNCKNNRSSYHST